MGQGLRPGHLFLIVLLGGCVSTGTVPPATPSAPEVQTGLREGEAVELPSGALELVEWIDTLGFPAVTGRPFVRVTTGSLDYGPDEERVPEQRFGFLVEDDEQGFAVVHDLLPTPYERGSSMFGVEVSHEPADLAEHVRDTVERVRGQLAEGDERYYLHRERSLRLQNVLLARAALRNGVTGDGRTLLALALRLPGRSDPLPGDDTGVSGVRGDIALVSLGDAIEDYAREELPRADLERRLVEIDATYPGTEAAFIAGELAGVIGGMIREDGAEEQRRRQASGAGRDEEIRRLVHDLRDGDVYTTIDAITAIGDPALPALVDMLDDRRVIRLPSYGDEMSADLARYAHVAQHILTRVAGRYVTDEAEARAWLADVQRHGQIEVLVRGVRARGEEALSQLERLIELEPTRGVAEAMALARTSPEPGMRSMLVRLVAQAPGDAQLRFLVTELSSGPIESRMAAAEGLAERNDPRWVAPIAAELTRRLHARSAAASADGQGQGQGPAAPPAELVSPYVLQSMLVLLVTRAGETGVETLRRLYPELSTEERMYILSSLGEIEVADAPSQRNIVELLAGALDDESLPEDGMVGGGDCVTVGDLAASVLAAKIQREFRCTASPRERQRARVALANAVRADSGEPPLPLPEEPRVPAPDAAEIDAARVALSGASGPEAVRAALSRYEAMGIGGLAPLLNDAADLPESHAARAAADQMSRRLASTLTRVTIDDSAVPLPNRAAYEARQGRPLGSRELLELLVASVASMHNGRLSVRLDRDGSGHGARLSIETLPAADARRIGGGFSMTGFVREGETSHRVQAYDSVMRALGRGAWRDATARLEPVLDGAPPVDGEAALLIAWFR